jgi:N-acetylglucosaminyldiphosphoundecaprenol N-acetyl-beta-D-mannosaminyltransferase
MSIAKDTFSVLGMPVHCLEDSGQWLMSRLDEGLGCHVVTLNAEMTMQAETNPALAQVIRQAELVIPDGAGVVLYLRLQGRKVKRCPGIELAESAIDRSRQGDSPHPIFFYGGAPGVAHRAATHLKQRYPGIAISGTQHGYIGAEEEEEFREMLQQLQPSLILVGLGVPRQELWIAEHRHLCPQAIWIGVGGSFDVWSGTKSRAPAWIGDNHLEWAYRLYQEPWRWRRMLALPKFAFKVLAAR